jgi:hypothetical protein
MQNKSQPADLDAGALVRMMQRDASHSPVLVPEPGNERRESDMDSCWCLEMIVEIAKVFWYDRHLRLRKGKPSVPQPPKSEEAM